MARGGKRGRPRVLISPNVSRNTSSPQKVSNPRMSEIETQEESMDQEEPEEMESLTHEAENKISGIQLHRTT